MTVLELIRPQLLTVSTVLDFGGHCVNDIKKEFPHLIIHMCSDIRSALDLHLKIPRFFWDPVRPCPIGDVWDLVIWSGPPGPIDGVENLAGVTRMYLALNTKIKEGRRQFQDESLGAITERLGRFELISETTEGDVLWALLQREW